MSRWVVAVAIGVVLACPVSSAAQSSTGRFEIGIQVPIADSSEFEATDVGVGGRFAWYPVALLGVESEVNVYPGDFPDVRGFSRSRVEGLFGVTVGPTFNRVRPFARVRAGFLDVHEAPGPIVCITIYPPTLACQLAEGATLTAFDVGGGVDVFATRSTVLRVDVGDRLIEYPGPSFDSQRRVHDEAFWSHDFRFAVGAAWRF